MQMLVDKLIHGQFYEGFYNDSFYVWGDECESAQWHWPTCLGVALSIAGALTSAYKSGYFNGYWDGTEGSDSRY